MAREGFRRGEEKMTMVESIPAGTVRRRHYLTAGPEDPLLTQDPAELLERFEDFVEQSGLPVEWVLLTPVVSVPLPVTHRDESGARARWSGVAPELMWHPFFWMPDRLAFRYQYHTIDEVTGGTSEDMEAEGDDVWAIRVMLEMSTCGLYDPTNGTWLDVLAYFGIDTDDPIDLARVQAWQEGGEDDVLDAIDLSDIVNLSDPENEDWAFTAARGLAEVIIPAQWSLSAATCVMQIRDQLVLNGNTDEERRKVVDIFGRLSAHLLRSIPPLDESDIEYPVVIETLVAENERPDSDSAYLLDTLLQVLSEVGDDYEPYIRGLTPGLDNNVESADQKVDE